jgi:DNA-binding MarR family transcriptional regulator
MPKPGTASADDPANNGPGTAPVDGPGDNGSAPQPGTAPAVTPAADAPAPQQAAAPPDAPQSDDPTEVSRWRPVFRLLSDMDDEIARVYADNGIEDLKPSWVLEIVRLQARGPMTIAELARSVGRTHSALSQKVAAMRAAGWLETVAGRDARSKTVTLTPKAERVAALLAAEWRATEAAISELEAELPYPLTQVAEDIRTALSRKSFHARITEHLSTSPTWTAERHSTFQP